MTNVRRRGWCRDGKKIHTWCRRSLFSAADFLFPHSMSFNCRFAFDMAKGETLFLLLLQSVLYDAQHGPSIIFACETFFYRFGNLFFVTRHHFHWLLTTLLAFVLTLIWWNNSSLVICYFWHLFNWLLTILLAHLSNLFGDRIDLKYKLLKKSLYGLCFKGCFSNMHVWSNNDH